jgi:hypothetical protein
MHAPESFSLGNAPTKLPMALILYGLDIIELDGYRALRSEVFIGRFVDRVTIGLSPERIAL